MKVLVTDGDNRAALAVTRSLGRLGHHVIVGEKHTPSLAAASRYCSGRVVYPDPTMSGDGFIDALVDVVRTERIDVLVPVADISTLLITCQRERFDAGCAIPFASAAAIGRAADKVDVVNTALRLGVPVPRTVFVGEPACIPDHDLGFPLVIKPRRSRTRTAGGWTSSGVSYAADHDELVLDLSLRPRHEFPLMLQERIVGPGVGVFACYHKGKAVALFSHRRLRERPPWGGVSVLCESVELCPLARDYATRLLDELGWQGVAMVEFKRDDRDGVPKLMEINGRFWGSLQLAIDAGVDFPALLIQTVHPGRFDPQPSYRIGVKSRWLWGDVDSLLVTLFGGRGAPKLIRGGRLKALRQFLKLRDAGLRYENPRWDDLRPWVVESYRWFRRALWDDRVWPAGP